MELIVKKTEGLNGEISIPGSKSHTIRAVIIACLAESKDTSIIKNPLKSSDTMAGVNACKSLGAEIDVEDMQSGSLKVLTENPAIPEKR